MDGSACPLETGGSDMIQCSECIVASLPKAEASKQISCQAKLRAGRECRQRKTTRKNKSNINLDSHLLFSAGTPNATFLSMCV